MAQALPAIAGGVSIAGTIWGAASQYSAAKKEAEFHKEQAKYQIGQLKEVGKQALGRQKLAYQRALIKTDYDPSQDIEGELQEVRSEDDDKIGSLEDKIKREKQKEGDEERGYVDQGDFVDSSDLFMEESAKNIYDDITQIRKQGRAMASMAMTRAWQSVVSGIFQGVGSLVNTASKSKSLVNQQPYMSIYGDISPQMSRLPSSYQTGQPFSFQTPSDPLGF